MLSDRNLAEDNITHPSSYPHVVSFESSLPPSQPLADPDRIPIGQGGVILVGMLSASRRTEQSQASGDGREVAAFAAGLPRLGSNLRLPRESKVAAKFNPESKWPGRRIWRILVVVVAVIESLLRSDRYVRTADDSLASDRLTWRHGCRWSTHTAPECEAASGFILARSCK